LSLRKARSGTEANKHLEMVESLSYIIADLRTNQGYQPEGAFDVIHTSRGWFSNIDGQIGFCRAVHMKNGRPDPRPQGRPKGSKGVLPHRAVRRGSLKGELGVQFRRARSGQS
jgi:hypothetical protein